MLVMGGSGESGGLAGGAVSSKGSPEVRECGRGADSLSLHEQKYGTINKMAK